MRHKAERDAAEVSIINEVLPQGVVGVDSFADVPEHLYEAESEQMSRAVPTRVSEYRTVRACARAALAEFGLERGPLLPGRHGAPQWPAGTVGSMTHCPGYRAAAVARREGWATIGIDAEPHSALPDNIIDTIALPDERDHLAMLFAYSNAYYWDRILFSAKESIYKAWSPVTASWLDFDEVRVRISPKPGLFSVELLNTVSPPDIQTLAGLTGTWLVKKGIVVTAAVAPHQPPTRPSR